MAGLGELDDADGLRGAARAVKQQVLADLPALLDQFADQVVARGGNVWWAPTAADARRHVVDIVRAAGATRVAKSKSMATEEIDLNPALEAEGAEVVETDLGEWIIQLAGETPSHIIAPALHKDRHQIKDLFVDTVAAPATLDTEPAELVGFARRRLREVFLGAEVGITGANLAVADTGSIVLVTNEGNGRLVTALPRIHVVVLGMERLAADWHQADLLLALLARSATGQRLSSYTNVVTGPRGRRRARRARRAARRDPRQRAQRAAGRRVPRDARLHPLRSVPERVPRLPADRRARLRLGLPGADGRGAHAVAGGRPARGGRAGRRVHPVRRLHGRLPRADPAPGPAAVPAPPQGRGRRARRAGGLEGLGRRPGRTPGATTPPPGPPRGAGGRRTWPATSRCGRAWAAGRTVPRPAGERFRDRWRAGL